VTKAQLAASEDSDAGTSASVADAGTASFATFDLHPANPSLLIFGGLQARRGSSLHAARERAIVNRYYTSAFGLPRDQLEPRPLRVGARVLAGTILGYLKADRSSGDPHLVFELRPAGADQALINPRPFLDAWTQLATLELHRKALSDPLYGPDLQSSDAGDALAMSQIDLERVVLDDGRLKLAMCERRAIAAGDVDRRVLATIEFLVDSGLDPTVSGARCVEGQSRSASSPAPATTDSVTITAINSTPVAGNQGTGTPTDRAIRALLTIPGADAPAQIASLETIPGAASTVADPSDADKIVVSFAPATTPVALASTAAYSRGFTLGTTRWAQLDAQLLAITQPRVPTVISTLALRTTQSTNSTK
jgi:hypothetical protein